MRKAFLLIIGFLSFSYCTQAQSELKVKWKQLGPISLPQYGVDTGNWSANGMGWIESIAVFEKNPGHLYAGSNTGGLYRTKNAGKKWNFAFDETRVCGVTDIVVDDKNPKKVWVATGVTVFDNDWGLGVLYSKNGGKRWQETGLSFKPQQVVPMWCLERSATNKDVFYACSETDIYKSDDACRSWKTVYDALPSERLHFRHLAIHNKSEKKVVATGDRIMITEDGGVTWKDKSPLMTYHGVHNNYDSLPDRYAMALNPLNNNIILVVYEYSNYDYIERSEDFGKTWRLVSKTRSFNRLDRNHAELAWLPTDTNVIIVGAVRMYFSEDRGLKFTTRTTPEVGSVMELHDDIRDLYVAQNGVVYTGNDGGVGVSYDKGKSWTDLSGSGLTVSQFFDIAVDSGKVVGGCQDLSSMIYNNGFWQNTSVIYGDGGNNLIHGKDIYVMQSGDMRKGTFENTVWKGLNMPFYAQRFSYPLMFSPIEGETIFAADHHIWSYSQTTKRWLNLTEPISPILTKIVAFDFHKDSVAYFAKDQPTWDPTPMGLKKRLYKGNLNANGIWDWIDITEGLNILAWRGITCIEINPANASEVYVGLYGFDGGDDRFKVFRSDSGGVAWQNISNGLPDVNVFKIFKWQNHLFIGTDGGVYYRRDADTTWHLLKGDLPNIHITDIEVDEKTNRLFVSTYGCGVWYFDLKKFGRR